MNTKKSVTMRLNKDSVTILSNMSSVMEKTQTDFVEEAIKEKDRIEKLCRSGGMVLTLPNPQNYIYTKKQAQDVIKILSKAMLEIAEINPALDCGLNEIVLFASQRLLKDSEKEKDRYKNNFDSDVRLW